jgi:DNA-binding MarR family transcriptional regulator
MQRDEVLKRLHDISELLTTIKPPVTENENIHLKGLPHSSRDILGQLYINGEMNQRTLSKHIGCSPQAISKSVSKLAKNGLIIKKNGSQKNENKILLTQVGKETANELEKIIEQYADIIFDGFSDHDISIFDDLLERIYKNLK